LEKEVFSLGLQGMQSPDALALRTGVITPFQVVSCFRFENFGSSLLIDEYAE